MCLLPSSHYWKLWTGTELESGWPFLNAGKGGTQRARAQISKNQPWSPHARARAHTHTHTQRVKGTKSYHSFYHAKHIVGTCTISVIYYHIDFFIYSLPCLLVCQILVPLFHQWGNTVCDSLWDELKILQLFWSLRHKAVCYMLTYPRGTGSCFRLLWPHLTAVESLTKCVTLDKLLQTL